MFSGVSGIFPLDATSITPSSQLGQLIMPPTPPDVPEREGQHHPWARTAILTCPAEHLEVRTARVSGLLIGYILDLVNMLMEFLKI